MSGWLIAVALLLGGILALGWKVWEEKFGEGWGWVLVAGVVTVAALAAYTSAGGHAPWTGGVR